MRKEEKELLNELITSQQGFKDTFALSQGQKSQGQKKIAQILIARGFVEEFQYKNILCYRATEKGHAVFYPLPQRLWFILKSDVRTVVVSIITALLTTILINKLL